VVLGADSVLGMEVITSVAPWEARIVAVGEHKQSLDACVSEAMRYGSEAISVPLDMVKKKDYEAMLSQALQAYGRVDYLVLNTGKDFAPPFMEWSGLSTAQRLPKTTVILDFFQVTTEISQSSGFSLVISQCQSMLSSSAYPISLEILDVL